MRKAPEFLPWLLPELDSIWLAGDLSAPFRVPQGNHADKDSFFNSTVPFTSDMQSGSGLLK